jgi:TRAP-type uncharacterized transport system substrate-binding protein
MQAQASERGERRVGGFGSGGLSPGVKTLLLFLALGLLGVFFALSDPEASLRHLKAGFLSGNVKGNYFAIVDQIAVGAARRKGRISNLPSAGSVENVRRLVGAQNGCSAHFALAQEGVAWPEGHRLELIGRLPRPESLVLLGRNADRISSTRDMRRMRIGIGPEGSGTEFLMRQLLAPLAALEFEVSSGPIDEQLHKLERGELDLGAMVIDQDAVQLQEAVRDRKLQILDLPRAEAVAHTLPFLRVGRIEAGHYDVVAALPASDKRVLQVDTLIVGNGCASRSATQGLITLLGDIHPAFLRYNRENPNLTGLPYAPAAHAYYESGGPDWVGVYAPWVIDIMPTASWVQLALGISVLLNLMGAANRFRLWRLDVARVNLESEIFMLLPETTTGDIARARPDPALRPEEVGTGVQRIIDKLEALYERCRKQSLSVLVPMGGEMAYRYQEALIMERVRALRDLHHRLQADPAIADRPGSVPPHP